MTLTEITQIGRATFVQFDDEFQSIDDCVRDESPSTTNQDQIIMNGIAAQVISNYPPGEITKSKNRGSDGLWVSTANVPNSHVIYSQTIKLANSVGEPLDGHITDVYKDARGLLVEGRLGVAPTKEGRTKMITAFTRIDPYDSPLIHRAYELVTEVLLRGLPIDKAMKKDTTATHFSSHNSDPTVSVHIFNPTVERVLAAAPDYLKFIEEIKSRNVRDKVTDSAGLVYAALEMMHMFEEDQQPCYLGDNAIRLIETGAKSLLQRAGNELGGLKSQANGLAEYAIK